MISHSTKIRSSRTRHMNAAAPQFGATGLVHLRDKDILTSVSRKFSGLPDEAARWFREITTFMDKGDLGPYKDNTVSVLTIFMSFLTLTRYQTHHMRAGLAPLGHSLSPLVVPLLPLLLPQLHLTLVPLAWMIWQLQIKKSVLY